ncbi:P-type domain-containing protein [Aphelenchoides bicaudatus]|nr:P-type domain-containing protein [Aphelenchoides bicaudatus]
MRRFKLFALLLCVSYTLANPITERLDNVDPMTRVDCAPDPNVSEDVCKSRGCSWSPTGQPNNANVPWCHFPSKTGYIVSKSIDNGYLLKKALQSPDNFFGDGTIDINFEQYQLGDAVRLVIGASDSFVPPIKLNKQAVIESTESLVVNTKSDDIFSFTVERKNGIRLWDTSIGGMITTCLNTLLGQCLRGDQPPDATNLNNMNLYSVHNFYIGLEDDGKAHGVFVLNTNAQEVTTGPGPHLIYRAIGGRFEVFVFPGPTPEDVIRQYQQVIGTPYLPAYWAFGYQLARYGFKSLDDLKSTVDRINKAEIPFDVIIADIDYMDRYKDFTINNNGKWDGFADYSRKLTAGGQHLTLMLDAGIEVDYDSFQRALDQGANFISWPRKDLVPHNIQDLYPLAKDTTFMLGVVWPDNHAAWPDFFDDSNKTNQWWANEVQRVRQVLGLQFDGIWIDMNEPSNFGTNQDHPWYYDNPDHPNDLPLFCPVSGDDSKLDFPPYHTQAGYLYGGYNNPLCSNTVCMLGVVNRGKYTIYDVKNLYGLHHQIATQQALYQTTGKRGQVIGRSTFPSAGHYGGSWLGDNGATFDHLKADIIGIQEYNLFGIPHVGADVCGFLFPTTEELCLRWHQLGAFHSYYRNHNDIKSPDQDPTQWPSVAKATQAANLFQEEQSSIQSSLTFQQILKRLDSVINLCGDLPFWLPPVIYPDVDSIDVYLPTDAEWYALYGADYGKRAESGHSVVPAPRDTNAPTFIRSGYIIPRQEAGYTAMGTHQNDFRLLITADSKSSSAFGELFWDDGETALPSDESVDNFEYYHFNFTYTSTSNGGQLVIALDKQPTQKLFLSVLDEIEVFNYPSSVSYKDVTVNGKNAKLSDSDCSYDAKTKVLRLRRPEAGIVYLNDHLPKVDCCLAQRLTSLMSL